jgi:hypothetical protein
VETAFLETMEFILTIVNGNPEVYFEAVAKQIVAPDTETLN